MSALAASWLWAVFTIIAAAAQTIRNAAQLGLTRSLGTAGATHVRFLFGFPFALVFFAGVVMSLGRALGETMAMLMVSGNIVQVPSSVFDSVRSLAANIALEMAYATGIHRSALFACGLVLIVIVTASTLISQRLVQKVAHGAT